MATHTNTHTSMHTYSTHGLQYVHLVKVNTCDQKDVKMKHEETPVNRFCRFMTQLGPLVLSDWLRQLQYAVQFVILYQIRWLNETNRRALSKQKNDQMNTKLPWTHKSTLTQSAFSPSQSFQKTSSVLFLGPVSHLGGTVNAPASELHQLWCQSLGSHCTPTRPHPWN